jgi:hypothetical protein
MNNYYLTSQLVAEHKAALAADAPHRAQLKVARAARKGTVLAEGRPARVRRLVFGHSVFGHSVFGHSVFGHSEHATA